MASEKRWYRPFRSSIPIGLPYGVKGNWKRGFHPGQDFTAPYGETARAAEAGVVVFAGDGGDGFGRYIKIVHADGSKTYYAHMSEIFVAIGQPVSRGQMIGLSGNSGNVRHNGHSVTPEEREKRLGAHCHVEARLPDGTPFEMFYENAELV